jgi:uridine kinase
MWDLKTFFLNLLKIENIPAILTVFFAMVAILGIQMGNFKDTDLLLWLIIIVGLLATSELIERVHQLKRIEKIAHETLDKTSETLDKTNSTLDKVDFLDKIEKYTHDTWDVLNNPKILVYSSRIDASQDIKKILSNESEGISIVAGSLGGTTRLVPDLSSILSKANEKNIRIRILISHPHYMALRAKLEGKSDKKQLQRTIETLFDIFENPHTSQKNIRLYLFVPTCWAVIAHEQRKVFLNPYTIGKRAEDTLSLMIDGNVYPDAYKNFINAHLEEPWRRNNLSISFEQFISEHNSEIAKSIADVLVKEYLGRSGNPLIVAINGCPAMGKSKLAIEIASFIKNHDKMSCSILETDGWLSKEREERIRNEMTGYNPESYDINGLSDAIKKLSLRLDVPRRTYNHAIGKPENGGTLPPADIIIIDGLMSTHQNFRSLINTFYWMDCSPDSQKERRLKRDIEKRGYSPELALRNWELHNKEWKKFESIYKPDDYKLMSSNRLGMLLLDT